ncbi:MAG: arsenate reductase family protein [Oscillospiraceae bacterium]|nr:arsenate reductase family protein [Oscillospiraceae bacterium]
MKLVCYPKCGTCKKAQVYLENLGLNYDYRDIKLENPSYEELKLWHEKSGLEMKRFFNTSGLLYKSMQLKDKLPSMTDEEKLQLLATDGLLVKRPIAIGDGFVLVGFKEKEWDAVFKK